MLYEVITRRPQPFPAVTAAVSGNQAPLPRTLQLPWTLAFMALTYLLVPLIFRRELKFRKLAQVQPWLFAIGVAGNSLFMMGAGTLGVSRRHWDITFADAILGYDYPATAFLMLGLNGLAALLAALGGILFIVVVVGSRNNFV